MGMMTAQEMAMVAVLGPVLMPDEEAAEVVDDPSEEVVELLDESVEVDEELDESPEELEPLESLELPEPESYEPELGGDLATS